MKIAIIGGGVSGLTAAWYLTQNASHDVVLYEAQRRLGGHTDTHLLTHGERTIAVDSGFIVFNERNYPHFSTLLRDLGIDSQNSDMSFSAVNEISGMEYGAEGLSRLFAQRRNIVSPVFYRMLWDLLRFYREAPAAVDQPGAHKLTLGDYLRQANYSRVFIDNHIIPMACALWSASARMIEAFPLHYFVAFMANHRMLQLNDRPQWKTVCGGSSEYVKALSQRCRASLRTGAPVTSVQRSSQQVVVTTEQAAPATYDAVIFACHSDQALRLLTDPSRAETDILGAIPYQANHVVLHSDIRQMPRQRAAWASWNARVPADPERACSVTYWMNLLQNLPGQQAYLVTLNPATSGVNSIDPATIWAERHYQHPVYTHASIAAQAQRNQINGQQRTWYCGAYWGWGFHEDGVRSALDVVTAINSERTHAAA